MQFRAVSVLITTTTNGKPTKVNSQPRKKKFSFGYHYVNVVSKEPYPEN